MHPATATPCWRRKQSSGWRVIVWIGLALTAGFGSAHSARAWGPHPNITQAALETLGTNHPLLLRLGGFAWSLTNYAWMADYKGVPYRDVEQQFYADDYLLFPEAPRHFDHICPEVKLTYRPFWRRAWQALQTEDAANAARWIGSLLHFIEDTGSPPHAAQIRGGIHANMENWVEASRIRIPEYRPVLLGTNVEDALEGLRRRMDGLIEFSRQRAERTRLWVELGNRTSTLPVVLESALETSRVVADVLHTLGRLHATLAPTNHATLLGTIRSAAPAGMEPFPARVTLSNTLYSTLADGHGNYVFHHLPAGEFHMTVLRPGNDVLSKKVTLPSGGTNRSDVQLEAGDGNVIRNPDFQLKWAKGAGPDYWRGGVGQWEGEIIPLQVGQRYRLKVDFATNATGDVFVRWTRHLPHEIPKLLQRVVPLPRIESKALTPAQPTLEFTGSESMALVQVTVRGSNRLEQVCRQVRLVPLPR